MIMVCGFMFDTLGERVLLIKKKRPQWQEGKFNGVGGRIKEEENPLDAMVREFKEETGIDYKEWGIFALGFSSDYEQSVMFYRASYSFIAIAKSMTDEQIVTRPVDSLGYVVPNLKWLIPLALDKTTESKPPTIFTFENLY